LFWHLFNESAIWWTVNVRRINLHKKHIKYLNDYILYGGFPGNVKEAYLKKIMQLGYKTEEKASLIEDGF